MGIEAAIVARGWIGTPYHPDASLKGVGCDCLGLLRGVWRALRGAEPEIVPAIAPDWTMGGERLRDACARHMAAVALADIVPGDVLLFSAMRGGVARHCGILAETGQTFIHARRHRRVREDLLAPFWRLRLSFVFRI